MVYGSLARSAGWIKGAIGAAWIAGIPLIAFQDNPPPAGVPSGSGAFSAMADIPFALFATGAALAALDAVEGRRKRAVLEAGLMLAFAALTKNEGLPLIAGVSLALLLSAPSGKWKKVALAGGIPLGAYALLWWRLARTFPALDEYYPGRLNWQAVSEGLDRVPGILFRLLEEIWFLPSWNLTWIAVIALLLISFDRNMLNRGNRLILFVCTFQLLGYVLAFTITSWTSPSLQGSGDSVPYLMNITLGRLLLHIAPLAVVLALRAAPLMPSRGKGAIRKAQNA
jgi:hypothetical protein